MTITGSTVEYSRDELVEENRPSLASVYRSVRFRTGMGVPVANWKILQICVVELREQLIDEIVRKARNYCRDAGDAAEMVKACRASIINIGRFKAQCRLRGF